MNDREHDDALTDEAGGWSAGQIERAWRSRHAFMTSGATSEMGWEDGERAGMAVALDSISGPPPTAAEIEEGGG